VLYIFQVKSNEMLNSYGDLKL